MASVFSQIIYFVEPERIALYLFSACILISGWIFRKQVSYLWAPSSIIQYGLKKMAVAIHFLAGMIIAGCVHILADTLFNIENRLNNYTAARTTLVIVEIFISGFCIGILIDKYFAATKPEFKEWKNNL